MLAAHVVCLVHELECAGLRSDMAKVTMSLRVTRVAHATWLLADTQDSSSPTQYVPLWSAQLERNTVQKLDV